MRRAALKRTPMKPRTSRLARRTRVKPVNRKRRAKNLARGYGSKARVAFVKSLGCVVATGACGDGPVHNHHVRSGGKSRKADASAIVGLCTWHHILLHGIGRKTFEQRFCIDLDALAEQTEQLWQSHLASLTPARLANTNHTLSEDRPS